MGRDRRIVDSSGNEALVDAALNALKVVLQGSTVTAQAWGWDGSQWLRLLVDSGGRLLCKLTDGTNVLTLLDQGDTFDLDTQAIPIIGKRFNTNTATPVPVANYSDPVASKGQWILPVTPMTGGRQEGTYTRGFIPADPVGPDWGEVSVANTTLTTVASYTTPSGKTFWLTDAFLSDAGSGGGVEFIGSIYVGTGGKWQERVPAGGAMAVHLHTPLKVTAGTACSVRCWQWSGAARTFRAAIVGFLTTDSELD